MTENSPSQDLSIRIEELRQAIKTAGGVDNWLADATRHKQLGIALDQLVATGEREFDETLLEWLRSGALRMLRPQYPTLDPSTLETAVQNALYAYTNKPEWRTKYVAFVRERLAKGHTNSAFLYFFGKAKSYVRDTFKVGRKTDGGQREANQDRSSDEPDRPRIEKLRATGPSALDMAIGNQARVQGRQRFRAIVAQCFSELTASQQEVLMLFAFGAEPGSAAEYLELPVSRVILLLSQAQTAFTSLVTDGREAKPCPVIKRPRRKQNPAL